MAEITLEPQQEPARLRIYIGAAPGVGKTYHMLHDAHLKRQQGEDVVIGLVETMKIFNGSGNGTNAGTKTVRSPYS